MSNGENADRTEKKGLFVDNQWMCNCNPRRPAVNMRVKKKNSNEGRWFWSCSKSGPSEGHSCGFFLWNDDAKPREIASLFGKTPQHMQSIPTPSRPLQQSRISDKPMPFRKNKSVDDGDITLLDASDVEGEDVSIVETPRKAQKTNRTTSPSKQSVAANTSETPSSRFQSLALNTPQTGSTTSTNTLRNATTARFDAISPVKKPDFGKSKVEMNGMGPPKTPSKPIDPNDPFASASKQGRQTPRSNGYDEPMDLEGEVTKVLGRFDVRLSNDAHTTLMGVLRKATMQSKGFRHSRNLIREKVRMLDGEIDTLKSTIGSLQIKTVDQLNMKALQDQIKQLEKENQEQRDQLADYDDIVEENKVLKRRFKHDDEEYHGLINHTGLGY